MQKVAHTINNKPHTGWVQRTGPKARNGKKDLNRRNSRAITAVRQASLPKPGLEQFALSHHVSSELASSTAEISGTSSGMSRGCRCAQQRSPTSTVARTRMESDLPAFACSAFAQ